MTDMRKIVRLAVVASLALSAAAFAGTSTSTVANLKVDRAGHLFIYFATNVSGGPACASEHKGMVMDATTRGGREQAALVQLAYAMSTPVTVVGQGNCALVSGWESVDTVETTTPGVSKP